MKNDERRRGFAVETRECPGEKGVHRGRPRAQGVEREEDGEARIWGSGGAGTARTVADWRPRARLRILGVMPVIRGSGAQ